MNLNNIYLYDHQSLSNSNTNNYRNGNQSFTQVKVPTNETEKVIFKIESDHLIASNASNFKLNISSSSNNNCPSDIKQNKQITTSVSSSINEPCKQETILKSENELIDSTSNLSLPFGTDGSSTNALNIYVNNVVCSYSTRCHLNLRRIAMEGMHVEYKKENGMVNMKLRKPYTTATMWSSGKVTCAGAKSEPDAYIAARRFCRVLQKMQFKVRMTNYRVVNVLATCNMPFGIDIQRLAENYQKECSYEPELHPGATFKLVKIKATLKLFTTGSITLTAPSVLVAQDAINQIYPILVEFKRTFTSDVVTNQSQNISKNQHNVMQKNYSQNGVLSSSSFKNTESKPIFNPSSVSNSNNYTNNTNLHQKPISTSAILINEPHHSSTNVNNVSFSNNSFNSVNNNYNSNLAHTYHQTMPSNTISSFNNSSPILTNNSLFVSSLPNTNSTSNTVCFNPIQPLISTSPFQTNVINSQPSHGWFYDNLLVDNVDDFLP